MGKGGFQALSHAPLLLFHDGGGEIFINRQPEKDVIGHQIPGQPPLLCLFDQRRGKSIRRPFILGTRRELCQPS